MGVFDFLKHKELTEIALLKKDLEIANEKSERLKADLDSSNAMCKELSKYREISNIELEKERIMSDIQSQRKDFEEEKLSIEKDIVRLKEESAKLSEEIEIKKKNIVELDETILLQEFGMYSPIYDFANSEQYKDRLDAIRTEQKNMILYNTAATCSTVWTVNGSEAQGRAMTNQNIKQILRCFNDECDMLINKVKFNNILAYIDKIYKSSDALNRMNTKNAVRLSPDYVKLKVDELQLAYEYAQKRQEEKEEQKRIRVKGIQPSTCGCVLCSFLLYVAIYQEHVGGFSLASEAPGNRGPYHWKRFQFTVTASTGDRPFLPTPYPALRPTPKRLGFSFLTTSR